MFHDGKIITFGGVNEKTPVENDVPNEVRINTVQTFYVKIPTLSQICWEAVNYYCLDLTEKPKISLIEEGIPEHFVSQLHA